MDQQGTQWAATANQREGQLLAMIEELRMQVQALQQRTAPTPAVRTRQVLPEPDRFTGRTRDWDTWTMAMQAKLRIDGGAIGSNEAQFYYVYSSLGTKVQGLVLAFVQKTQKTGDWKPFALLDYLEHIYDDPNKAKKAGQRLIELRQGTMSITAYLPQFEKTMFEAGADDWPDNAKITTLVGGLNKYTRQRIDGQLTLPTDYNKFVRMLQMLGNQFGHLHSNGSGSSYGNGNGSNKGNAMEWEPIQVANAKVAPSISREQRQIWREKGKCVRCGSGGHWVKNCNSRPTRSRSSSSSSVYDRAMVTVNAVQPARTKTTAKPSRPFYETQADSDSDTDY